MAATLNWRFENTYADLPPVFFAKLDPTPVREPRLVIFNESLAQSLGLTVGLVESDGLAQVLAGNTVPAGATPLAQAYAGHQFGGFSMLGDGRAIVLGEHIAPAGERVDIQFKGSGPTPFSRRGDGRAALGPMLREYLISEAMHGLGIPTTRSLAVVATGEPVFRQTTLPGAVLTRVAASHLRVGTFQYAAACQDIEALRRLVTYAVQRHVVDLEGQPEALALLRHVVDGQASLLVHWMRVGFIHGVMNTDNMTICGETIDYGPCAFMDTYDPATVFSSIDHGGRYAFGNQPGIAQWNLLRLAEALLPLLHEDEGGAIEIAKAEVSRFAALYESRWLAMMLGKLGLEPAPGREEPDRELVDQWLACLHAHQADYTNAFLALMALRQPGVCAPVPAAAWLQSEQVQAWLAQWRLRSEVPSADSGAALARMAALNPVYIPRNHQVEAALDAAQAGDLEHLRHLLDVVRSPYQHREGLDAYQAPAASGAIYQTFCGT